MAKEQKLHALVFPLPHQGHLTPTISLVLKLASKGFTVTFVNFEYVHKMMSKVHNKATTEFDLLSEARQSGLDIHYTTISDGLPDEFDRVSHLFQFYEHISKEFQPLLEEFVFNIISSDPNSIYFSVADTLFLWQILVAKKCNLIHVTFSTQAALVFSLTYHFKLLEEKGHYPLKDIEENIDYIPGIPSINTKDLMPKLKESNINTIVSKLALMAYDLTKKADFVLHNTAEEFESKVLSALENYQPTYAIGPINFCKENSINKSLMTESRCSKWLESKPPRSVLYVSFGTVVSPNKKVVEEIAHGLILSDVNFIWITRDAVEGSDLHILPDEFRDGFNDKGLIIPWCNQNLVLSDPAIAGFVTHCGWNSVLESIWYGIPMICYPVDFDQPTNRKLVVDDWGIGINLCEGKTIDRNEIAAKIKCVMIGESSRNLKDRIKKLQCVLRNAIEPDGSSERNFDKFIRDLKKKLGAEDFELEAPISHE